MSLTTWSCNHVHQHAMPLIILLHVWYRRVGVAHQFLNYEVKGGDHGYRMELWMIFIWVRFVCHSVILRNCCIITSFWIMVRWGLWGTLGLHLNVMIYGGTDSIICSQKWLGIEKGCVNMPWSVPRIWFVDTNIYMCDIHQLTSSPGFYQDKNIELK